MKTIRPPRASSLPGLTLLEATVVLGVLLMLLSVLFLAANAWKKSSDRAGCVMTLRNLQVAVRSYQNTNGFKPGDTPDAGSGNSDIAWVLKQKEYLSSNNYAVATGAATCAGGGIYTRVSATTFPQFGVLYAQCSLAASGSHSPDYCDGW